jgi:mono/diheme cytochrome c family protein
MGNRIKRIGLIALAFASLLFLTLGASLNANLAQWKAPSSADKLKNPSKGNASAIENGKELYGQMCGICHGDEGEGDGMGGMSLNPKPTDLTLKSFQSQSDGAIFWKITEGRSPMASYKSILTDEQRWQLVNFIKTFKK